jgi:hypothetical protein
MKIMTAPAKIKIAIAAPQKSISQPFFGAAIPVPSVSLTQ